jgi:pimeloyl-ACP methyl ester carboxylesterase
VTDGLLLIHAWPLDARMWDAQREVVRDVPVVAPHLPGFGGAEPAGDVLTMRAATDRLLAKLDAADVERAVVCGLSLGGYIAFELWRVARDRVAGLVLANTRAVADSPEGAEGRRALAARLRSEGNVLVDEPPPLLAEDASEDLWARVKGWIADQPAEAIAAAALGMAERPDSSPDLTTIDVPTLVITSTADRLIPPAITAEMAGQIPGARLQTIEGAGHLSNVEAAEAFAEALGEHMELCGIG